MDYLLSYVEHRRLHGAPRFKDTVLRSFYLRVFLLLWFLPLDLLYIFLTRKRRRHPFDVIVFSEKYKKLAARLNGNVALITVPSFSLFFQRHTRVYYFPASVFFVGTFFSLCFNRILATNFLRFGCSKLVLHTDGMPVPRYLLKCLFFEKAVCIQHGEFKYLNDIYDGILCDENIVLGSDQAELFKKKGYHGIIRYPAKMYTCQNLRLHEVDFVFDQIVLVGQGYHVNDIKLHNLYQKKLFVLFRKLKARGFNVVYRPHPSEYPIHYGMFFLSREKTRSRRYVNIGRLYVGTESTLLRKVRELGGISMLVDELTEASLVLLEERFSRVSLRLPDTLLDEPFIEFVADALNDAH